LSTASLLTAVTVRRHRGAGDQPSLRAGRQNGRARGDSRRPCRARARPHLHHDSPKPARGGPSSIRRVTGSGRMMPCFCSQGGLWRRIPGAREPTAQSSNGIPAKAVCGGFLSPLCLLPETVARLETGEKPLDGASPASVTKLRLRRYRARAEVRPYRSRLP